MSQMFLTKRDSITIVKVIWNMQVDIPYIKQFRCKMRQINHARLIT